MSYQESIHLRGDDLCQLCAGRGTEAGADVAEHVDLAAVFLVAIELISGIRMSERQLRHRKFNAKRIDLRKKQWQASAGPRDLKTLARPPVHGPGARGGRRAGRRRG